MEAKRVAPMNDMGSAAETRRKAERQDAFLGVMSRVVPWAKLAEWVAEFCQERVDGYQRPADLTQMLKLYFLQQWYALSDGEVVKILGECEAAQQLVGIRFGREPTPTEAKICNFRRLLKQCGLAKILSAEASWYQAADGLNLRQGTLPYLVFKKIYTQGVDIFTSHFVFDVTYAEKRNSVILHKGCRRTLLSIFLESISSEQRSRIFPGIFDLGNRVLSDALFTKRDLADELSQEFMPKYSVGPIIPRKTFAYIEPWVATVTGQTVEQHMARNSLATLKVMKLLYRIMKKRSRTVLQLIHVLQLGMKPSMEHRDRYPLRGNEDQVWLLADVKSYLRVEIDETRAQRIDAFFESLLPTLQEVITIATAGVTWHLRSVTKNDHPDNIAFAKNLHCGASSNVDSSHEENLDERLYVHLHSLKFLNYVEEYTQIVKETTPDRMITSVAEEIEELRESVYRSGASAFAGGPIAPLTESTRIYECWKDHLIPIIGKAVGVKLEPKRYKTLIGPATELLHRYFLFKWGYQHSTLCPLSIFEYLAAACSIWHEVNAKTTYRPFWFGQQDPGRRILPALDNRPSEHWRSEPHPEARNHIWAVRYRWMADAIKGNQQANKVRSSVSLAVLHYVSNAVRSGNIEAMERALYGVQLEFR